jgi:hypothetical protein
MPKTMKNPLLISILLSTVLMVMLLTGPILDFRTISGDTFATYTIGVLILMTIIAAFNFTRQVNHKTLKVVLTLSTSILTLLYFLVGVWTMLIITPTFHPMWEDKVVWTNSHGDKVIHQFRETSGSIHDYRDIKVLADYNSVRLFIQTDKKKLKGEWFVFDIEKLAQDTVDFGN